MSDTTTYEDVAKLSFEEALAELETLVRKLETGGQTLDDSIEHYGRGTALKTHCEKKLQEAKLKVEKIVSKADGSLATENFDAV
jgi:exodeoxyribonuclease VII small subunit